jgi:hypothetical protein
MQTWLQQQKWHCCIHEDGHSRGCNDDQQRQWRNDIVTGWDVHRVGASGREATLVELIMSMDTTNPGLGAWSLPTSIVLVGAMVPFLAASCFTKLTSRAD